MAELGYVGTVILGSSKCKQQCRTSHQKPHLHNVRLRHGVAQPVWKCSISAKEGKIPLQNSQLAGKKLHLVVSVYIFMRVTGS